MSLSTGSVSLHETLRPPAHEWKWSTAIRTGDGTLLALSEIKTSISVPVSFNTQEIGRPDAVVREVCVSKAPQWPVARAIVAA